MISNISFSTLQCNLKTFCLGTRQHIVEEEKVKPLQLGSKVSHLGDEQYHKKRVQTLASYYIQKLKTYPQSSVHQALKDDFIYREVRNFLRKEGKEFKKDPLIIECKRHHLAAKLGLTFEILEKNEGFEEYAAHGHLERYLFTHGEDLVVVDGEIHLKYKGSITSWSKIYSERIPRDPKPEGKLRYPQPYDKTGVVWNKDFFVFDELEPMFEYKDGSRWGNIDILEICSCKSVDNWMSIFTGAHSWFRIKTSDGKLYSFGLYRPEKLNGWGHLSFPFRTQVAFLGYEVSEYWPLKEGDFRTIPVQITAEERDQILAQIKNDKSKLTYQGFHENCVLYSTDLLSKFTGKILPTYETPFGVLNPKKIKWITSCIPEIVRRVCVAIGSILILNPLQVLLGAALVDKKVKQIYGDKKQAHIASIWDFFNPGKAWAHHPYTVMFKTYEWVKEWQKKEEKRLKEENPADFEEKLKLLPYQIPPNGTHFY